MARMYAKRKGKSGSTKPHNESAPEWSNTDSAAVTELIVELGKEGHSSATIGTILRDQHAVPDARLVLGKRISAVLAAVNLHLITKPCTILQLKHNLEINFFRVKSCHITIS